MSISLQKPLILPCGARLTNRLAKAAMTEGLADSMNRATAEHQHLYRRWAENDFGLMLTGNIQVDRRHLERPGNIAIDNNGGLEELRALASIGTRNGAHFWAQLNHPGRQTPASINPKPLAPSAISLPMAEAGCGQAQAMTGAQIKDVIQRFVHAAAVCRDAGFTGIQIHAAHGYLFSQFLSPLANHRTDEWGGPLENRVRLLLETVRAVRASVGEDFPISVKLNSADFQRGGFSEDESMQVVRWLGEERIDLLEISGGNYEQMSMVGLGRDESARPMAASTAAREAYFFDYAQKVRAQSDVPVMITGGMRSSRAMNEVLESGDCQIIGLARPLCTHPDSFGRDLLAGRLSEIPALDRHLALQRDALGPDIDDQTFKRIESFGLLSWFCLQLKRIGEGEESNPELTVFDALLTYKQNETTAAAAWSRPM